MTEQEQRGVDPEEASDGYYWSTRKEDVVHVNGRRYFACNSGAPGMVDNIPGKLIPLDVPPKEESDSQPEGHRHALFVWRDDGLILQICEGPIKAGAEVITGIFIPNKHISESLFDKQKGGAAALGKGHLPIPAEED